MIKLFEVSLAEDLAPLTRQLWQRKIPHRVIERGDVQELWLARDQDAETVMALQQHIYRGEDPAELELPQSQSQQPVAWISALRDAPITLSLVALSLVLTLLVGFGDNTSMLRWLTFADFRIQGNSIIFQSLFTMLKGGEWWRLLSPALLHFSLLHLVFNLLWTWELGRRIEARQYSWYFLALAVVLALTSNAAQFLVTGPMFGGLSGVIFGLLGYTWLWDRMNPEARFGLPPTLMVFMLVWLVLGVSGAVEAMGFGAVANMAHLSGLLVGLALAPVASLIRNFIERR